MITHASTAARLTFPLPETSAVTAPPFWASTWNGVRRWVRGPLANPPRSAARDSLILDAAVALRGGRVEHARALLAPHSAELARDAAYLNLLGVACELRREWKLAGRFYGVAMSVDPACDAAQRNLRRLYELNTFGRSAEPIELGDAAVRRNRTVSPTHDNQ